MQSDFTTKDTKHTKGDPQNMLNRGERESLKGDFNENASIRIGSPLRVFGVFRGGH